MQRRIIFVLIYLSLVPLLIAGYYSYSNFYKNIESNTSAYSQDLLEQVSLNFESQLNDIRNTFGQLLFSKEVQEGLAGYQRFNDDQLQEASRNISLKSVQMLERNFNSIANIQIVLGDGRVLSPRYEIDIFKGDYYRSVLFEQAKQSKGELIWMGYNAMGDVPVGDEHLYLIGGRRITFLNRLHRDEELLGYAFITLRDDIFREIFNRMKVTRFGYVWIADQQGRLIAKSDTSVIDPNTRSQIMEGIRSSRLRKEAGKSNVHFLSNVEGSRKLVTYAQMESTNWTLISVTDFGSMMKRANQIRFFLFLIMGLCGAAAILVSIWVARSISRPVRFLAASLNDLESGRLSSPAGRVKGFFVGEMDDIYKRFPSLMYKIESLEQSNASHRTYVRDEVLRRLMLHPLEDIDESAYIMAGLNSTLTAGIYQVCVYRLDRFRAFMDQYTKEDQQLLKQTISTTVLHTASESFKCEIVDMSTDSIALILRMEDGADLSDVVGMAGKALQQVQEVTGWSVTVGVGSREQGLIQLHHSYRIAYMCSNYRIRFGPGTVLTTENVKVREPFIYPSEEEKYLLDGLRSKQEKRLEEVLSRFIDRIQDFSYSDIMFSMVQLLLNGYRSVQYSGNAKNRRTSRIDYMELNYRVQQIESILELKEWALSLFREIIRLTEGSEANKNLQLVDSIIEEIELRYADPMLTIGTLALKAGLNAKYLGRLYKEMRGETIGDSINRVRLEHSKIYLIETDLTVDEIARKVGFLNDNYFYTLFKKNIGMTPAKYRNQHHNQ